MAQYKFAVQNQGQNNQLLLNVMGAMISNVLMFSPKYFKMHIQGKIDSFFLISLDPII